MANATVHHCCFQHHRFLRASYLCEPCKRLGNACFIVQHCYQESVCARHCLSQRRLVHAVDNKGAISWCKEKCSFALSKNPWRVVVATVGLGGNFVPGIYVINFLSFSNKKFCAICCGVFWHGLKIVSLLLAAKTGVHCCVSDDNSRTVGSVPSLTLQESKYDSCSTFYNFIIFIQNKRNVPCQKQL